MKNIYFLIAIALFLLTPSKGLCQGNLQFNKVVFVEADTTFTCANASLCLDSFLIKEIVVQPGKVLKLESLSFLNSTPYHKFFFNNLLIRDPTSGLQPMTFPIWLPAGTYRFKFKTTEPPPPSPTSNLANYYISAIEFNITQ